MKTTFSHGKTQLSVLSFPAQSEAIAYLRDSDFVDLTNDECADYQCHFRVVECQSGTRYLFASATDDDFLIAQYSDAELVLAYDHYLYWVSMNKHSPDWIHDCDESIWTIFINGERILVHTELGFSLLDINGNIVWETHFGELFNNVKIDDGVIILEDFQHKTSRLSFETGQPLEPGVGEFSA